MRQTFELHYTVKIKTRGTFVNTISSDEIARLKTPRLLILNEHVM